MSKTIIRVLVVALAALVMEAAPYAQEQVTVVRRTGDKVSGRFEDWNRQTDAVYVRVNPSDQRQFPMRDVLVIDVGGNANNLPANETQAAQQSDHVLVTRGGEMLKGRLVNIEGGEGSAKEGEPRTVTFQSGGERRLRMSEVARIYLGNYPQQTTGGGATPATPVPQGAIRVPANQRWTATNITIRQGDRVQFSAEGEVQLSGDPEDKASAAGSLKGRKAPGAPAPDLLAGALIGRLGAGQPFAIGNQTNPLPMPGQGPLWLGINDDEVGDNSGQLAVTIRVIPGR
ncbi:MAG: hypothetical protein OEW19_12415 [Acidobacteriota bacterium]|nr:hypothetical protein [Acidobacteriota bacterium]